MGLRAKVAFLLAAAIVPISIGFSAWRIAVEHREMTERRVDRFAARLQRFDDGSCMTMGRRGEQPRRRGRAGGGPGLRPDLYSDELVPHGSAPAFPPELSGVLDADEPVHRWKFPGDATLGVTAVRLAERGECAIAVIRWRHDEVPRVAIRSAALQTIGLAFVLALLGGLVALPIVRRIRRLEDAVRRARDEDFDLTLSGADEINALADAFQETLAAVRQRENALEEYIANTTHDLAIPLTVLQHRLRKLIDTQPSDDARVALEESHYIAGLIANMRTSAKLDRTAGTQLEHSVDLAELVERVVQRHSPIAEQRGVELNYAVPENGLVVQGEPTLVEQALSNLVQNAVQYNAAGGHVSIVLEPQEQGFELTVADDGPGIAPSMRDAVMQRGVRDDHARTRNVGGQGFGLAIVRRVVDLHGWSLTMEHEVGLLVRISASRLHR